MKTLILLLLLVPGLAQASQGGTIIIASKLNGACGIMNSMVEFQRKAKIRGGDEFVGRFWAMETARLGIPLEEYVKLCSRAYTVYQEALKAADE